MDTTENALAQPPPARADGRPHLVKTATGVSGLCSRISRPWFKLSLLVAGDFLCLMAAHQLASASIFRFLGVPVGYPAYYLLYLPFFAAIFYSFEGYKDQALRRSEKELELVFKGVSYFFAALVCADFIVFKSQGSSRYLLVVWYGLTLSLVLATRFSLRGFYSSLWRRGWARQTALLVGELDRMAGFQQELAIQRYRAYDLVGILVERLLPSDPNRAQPNLPVVGLLEDWEKITARYGIQLLLLSLPTRAMGDGSPVLEVVRRCQKKGIEVEVYSDLFGSPEFKYERDEFSGFFRFHATPGWSRAVHQALKTMLDRLVGLIGSLVVLLVTPVVGLLIKWEDRGPVFYRSAYLGQDGKDHFYLKFRTMRSDADQVLASDQNLRRKFEHKFKLETDPRVTRIGKWLRKYSLDEFPQFFGVLLGDLSFVGPRTIRREEAARYGSLLPKLLSCKPGVTGFWQVMGRQTTTYGERVQMDMFYIEHWSIWLDLVIMTKTFWEVLRADGAY